MTKEQISICAAIAKHFQVKRPDVIAKVKSYLAETGLPAEYPNFEIEFGVYGHLRLQATKNTIRLGMMLYINSFKKSAIYSDFIEMENSELSDVLCFFSGGKLMCVYRDEIYDGVGGIFMKDADSSYNKHGIVIEPFEHYLKNKYEVFRELD
jgi:hypothetical protein